MCLDIHTAYDASASHSGGVIRSAYLLYSIVCDKALLLNPLHRVIFTLPIVLQEEGHEK